MELLLLEPVFKQMIWGGSRLRDDFGYDIPGDNTGECWAISAHPYGDCTLKNTEYKGRLLMQRQILAFRFIQMMHTQQSTRMALLARWSVGTFLMQRKAALS